MRRSWLLGKHPIGPVGDADCGNHTGNCEDACCMVSFILPDRSCRGTLCGRRHPQPCLRWQVTCTTFLPSTPPPGPQSNPYMLVLPATWAPEQSLQVGSHHHLGPRAVPASQI